MSKRIAREDIDRFHDYSLYIPQRTIYIGSEYSDSEGESGVDAIMASRVIKSFTILDTLSADPITILLNNPGGEVNHGLAIYDVIKASKAHVTIKVIGQAMSMGSIILQAADDRIMSENASQMIHYGSLSVDSEARTAYKIAEECKRIDKWMEKLYLDKIREKQPGFSLGKLKNLLTNDTFLTARESIELGLADKILGE